MSTLPPATPAPSAPFPYDGPQELREPVLAALTQVVDPEVALSIVDLGLIYGALAASRWQLAGASAKSAGSSTRRIPLPPPPATALISAG